VTAGRFLSGLFCLLAGLLPGAAAATETPGGVAVAELEDAIREQVALYNQHGRFDLPAFADGDVLAMASGEPVVVSLLEADGDETRSMAFVGAKLIEAPRLLVWLTALGGNNDYRSSNDDDKAAGRSRKSRVTHAMLSRADDGSYVRYQHVRLPWPFRDRHWAIHLRKNPAVAEATRDRVWEHYWFLEDDGLEQVSAAIAAGSISDVSPKMLKKSIYLPANQGSWITLELDAERTLLLAYVDVDLGGNFPRSLVRGFTESQLKAGLDKLPGYVSRVSHEYDAAPTIHDGRGRHIEPADATRIADSWRQSKTKTTQRREHP
jgi:hypothetical protein